MSFAHLCLRVLLDTRTEGLSGVAGNICGERAELVLVRKRFPGSGSDTDARREELSGLLFLATARHGCEHRGENPKDQTESRNE
jgi:hypothetical protein